MRVLAVAGAALAFSSVAEAKKESPIRRIVNLLKDMSKQMAAEKEDDEAVYAKLACWCKKNREEKTGELKKAIADIDAQLGTAKQAFEAMQALEKKRNAEVADRTAKAKEETDTREECSNAHKEFSAKDMELKETIRAANTAVTILKGGQSLLQTRGNELVSLVQKLAKSKAVNELAVIKPDGLIALQNFLEEQQTSDHTSFLQAKQPVGYQNYASQSGGIVGTLSQMAEDLKAQVSDAAKEEEARRAACKESLDALNTEISSLTASIDDAEQRIGKLAAENAEAKEAADLANTARLNAQEFLAKLEAQCAEADEQFASRTASRNEEMKAIADTIEILDSDEAFSTFGKTVKKTVVLTQIAQEQKTKDLPTLAVWALEQDKKNPRVFLIQQMIKSATKSRAAGVFTKVIKAIEDLRAELKQAQADEVDMKNNCVSERDRVVRENAEAHRSAEEASAKSDELAAKIKSLDDDIAAAQESVVEMDKATAEATELRKEEAAGFATARADHTATQEILQKAIDRMGQVYKGLLQQPGAAVVEFSADETTPGSSPAAFTKSGSTTQNEGGNKVVTLLSGIMEESQHNLAMLEQDETNAIANYNEFMRTQTRDKKAAQEEIAAKTKTRETSDAEKADADADHKTFTDQALALTEEYETIQKAQGCEFLVANFDSRQAKRSEEMAALNQAKFYLQKMN